MVSVPSASLISTSTLASSPTGPLARRSTLVRKRDEDDVKIPPSSPGKKLKVTFDSDVEVRIVGDLQSTPEFVQAEVRQAFEKRTWGDDSNYNQLKEIYDPKEDLEAQDPETLKKHTLALLCNVSYMTRQNADLVHIVLNSNWLSMSDDYVSLFMRLLASLLSSQGTFLGDALRMLMQNLTSSPPSYKANPKCDIIPRSAIYSRAHKAISYLLQLLPPAARVLHSITVSLFPPPTASTRSFRTYIKNLLKIIDYAPEIGANILNLITDRLIKVDVQVQVDLEDLTDEAGESLINRLPQNKTDILEHFKEDDISESGSESDDEDEDEDKEARRDKEILQSVEKMDVMLDVMFAYYDRIFSTDLLDNQMRIVDTLLSQFTTIILPAHRSRHTQFLMFHFLQKSGTYLDTFVGTCVQIAFDQNKSPLIRQAAAAYLASFVARGVHVPGDIVRDVYDYIGAELTRLRRIHEPGCIVPDIRRYSSYYCLVQALLYIFCFRWRDLEVAPQDEFEDEDTIIPISRDRRWRPGVKETLSINVFSRLNPLKVCSPAIVNEFARVANHLSFVYVYHLLETNKRLRLSHIAATAASSSACGPPARETALSARGDEAHLHLDEYFPFDPYHLPQSKRWVEGDYREWAGIPGLDEDEATNSENDGEDGVSSDGEEGTETDRTGQSL